MVTKWQRLQLPSTYNFRNSRIIDFAEAREIYPALSFLESPDALLQYLENLTEKDHVQYKWILDSSIYCPIIDGFLAYKGLTAKVMITELEIGDCSVSPLPDWIGHLWSELRQPRMAGWKFLRYRRKQWIRDIKDIEAAVQRIKV